MESTTTAVDEAKLEQFMGQAVTDMGAAMNGVLVMIGGELGLWKAMAGAGPLTRRDRRAERHRRALCARVAASAQAASGYLDYDPEAEAFTLPPEQAMALADEDSPVFMLGGFHSSAPLCKDRDEDRRALPVRRRLRLARARPGSVHRHRAFFRPGYRAHLIAEWIPALEGVEEKLHAGAKVADIGCGHGASTVAHGRGVSRTRTFLGFDYHDASIERARELAGEAGVDNTDFDTRERQGLPGRRTTTSSASSTACTTWATRSAR